MTDAAEGPNEAQARFWNTRGGSTWVQTQKRTDATLGPLGSVALDAASIEPGHRVLDIGCGCGDTSLAAADMAGETGDVVGIDISEPMLDLARTRASGRNNVVFVKADAQTADLGSLNVDRVVSRFGVMFFDDPVAAFSNIGAALNQAGQISFVCWQTAARNPWMSFTVMAVGDLLEFPKGDPHSPGPFSFADESRVRQILDQSGFRQTSLIPLEGELDIVGGAKIDDAVAYSIEMSPIPGMVSHDPALAEAVGGRVTDAFDDAWDDGAIRLPYSCWIVTAQR